MKPLNLAKTAAALAREPIVIEAVRGPTRFLNKRGDNVGQERTDGSGIVFTISLPRVRWLERETPHG
jgi:hypothetical protein